MHLRRSFKLASAAFAFILWGTWAYFVNEGSSIEEGLKAAWVQGGASFIITLLMVHTVTWLHERLPSGKLQAWLPSAITISCTGSALIVMHLLAGTPQILPTIAPALLVGGLFCLFTSHTLRKMEAQHGQSE